MGEQLDLNAKLDHAITEISDDTLDRFIDVFHGMRDHMSHPTATEPAEPHTADVYAVLLVRFLREKRRRQRQVRTIADIVHGPVLSWWGDPSEIPDE
jgi:hypothetical protein